MSKKIIVLGSFNMDLCARANHLPQKGETVLGVSFQMGAGGKGFNQGVASKKSGGDVTMISKIGNDEFGKMAVECFKLNGLDTENILYSEKETGTAIIMVDDKIGQNQIVVTPGANCDFSDDDIPFIKKHLENADYLLMQLEINLDMVEKIIDLAYEMGVKVILNPAPAYKISDNIYSKLYAVTPNEIEAGEIAGVDVKCPEDAAKAADYFIKKGTENVVITLGKQGVLAKNKDTYKVFDNYDIKVLDTVGAGDALNGGFVTGLSLGKDLFDSVFFANIVSNLAVSKKGASTAMPTLEEINNFINNGYKL